MEASGLSVKMKQGEAKLGSVCRSEFTLYVLLGDVLFNEFSLKKVVSELWLLGNKSHEKGKTWRRRVDSQLRLKPTAHTHIKMFLKTSVIS